ncbi:nucleotidyltransferase domain-containing protein [Candidatus Woesearchaeota archaeon]|nr:nucleotidyltransferase domain-containing protein [Candidatus Woesearchaeota archaeon]
MANEKLSILKLLIESQDKKLSIRKISKIRKINYKSAYNAVKKLEKENIIHLEKTGNTTICSFNQNFNETVFEAECQRRKEILQSKNMLLIQKDLSDLRFPFILLLFGSYAKGEQTRHSDIDLLAIGGEKSKIESALSRFPFNIHLTAVSFEEFTAMAKSREFTVVSEAQKRNIILIGIEEYYRLLKNAK